MCIVTLYLLSCLCDIFCLFCQLRCAQMVSSKLGEQKESVVQALREAEDRFKRYLSKQVKEEKEMSSLITEEASEGDEDIKWLLESGNKKVCLQSV